MTQPKFPLTDSEKVGRYISVKKRGQLCSKCTLQQDIQQSFMYLRSYSFLQFSNLFKLQQKQYINICRVNSTRQKKNALSLEKWRTTLPKTCWLSDSQLLIRRGLFACLQAIWPQTVTHQTVENRGMRASLQVFRIIFGVSATLFETQNECAYSTYSKWVTIWNEPYKNPYSQHLVSVCEL